MSVQIFCLSLFLSLSLSLITDHKDCPAPRVRNSWTSLTTDQQQLYLTAVQLLKNYKSGPAFTVPKISTYDIFPIVHNYSDTTNCAHGSSIFLPWHRRFLWIYETALQQAITNYNRELTLAKETEGFLDACVTVPYWEWENDYGNTMKASVFSNDTFGVPPVAGCLETGKFAGWNDSSGSCLTRQYLMNFGGISTGAGGMMNIVVNSLTYWDFEAALEASPHASIHNFLGGNMMSMTSPDDPLFFLHHANVDRFWTMWQDCHDFDIVPPSETTSAIYPAQGFGFETNVCSYGIDAPLSYTWLTGQETTLFTRTTTSRMTLSLGSPTEQYGPDKMYYRYGPDTLVETMLDPRTWTNGNPVCKFDGDWINYQAQNISKKRSEQLLLNNNKTYLFGTAANERTFDAINREWGHHPTQYRIIYLALWECSLEVLGNTTLSVSPEWVLMNNFENNNTFLSLCDRKGYHDGYEAYANLVEEQLFSKGQVEETGLESWQLALILTVVILIVVGILTGVIVWYIRKKSMVSDSKTGGLQELLLIKE